MNRRTIIIFLALMGVPLFLHGAEQTKDQGLNGADRTPPPQSNSASDERVISLAGEWRLQLDPQDLGRKDRWFSRPLEDRIQLPGTLDEGEKGSRTKTKAITRLSRVYDYKGKAWFQRDIEVPEDWAGRRILFTIERTKHATVWLDDRLIGIEDTLTTEQVFDLGKDLRPGKHSLTVLVDNANLPKIDGRAIRSHQTSAHTQTNWNGLLGRIELRAHDSVWIQSIRAVPNVADQRFRVVVELGREPGAAEKAAGKLTLSAQPWNVSQTDSAHGKDASAPTTTIPFKAGERTVEAPLALGDDAMTWDEFSPVLYRLRVTLSGNVDAAPVSDVSEIDCGLREFTRNGTQFSINGMTTFLRGKNDACVFPLTGYAPMSVGEWVRILRIAKSYGINHYRFHSWCPPEAAFAAADIVGIYVQPELPNWYRKTPDRPSPFLLDEGHRILRAYAHHPSFVMFAMGNELIGSRETLSAMIDEFRKVEPHILYAQGSNAFMEDPKPLPEDDYWTTILVGGSYISGRFLEDNLNYLVRGSYSVYAYGHINNRPPSSDFDYNEAIKNVTLPVIGHEIGQFQVFPNFKEIEKYTGVLEARNFEVFRERLKQAGMLDQADQFVKASGALAVICYREDIETALRTKGFGGFQLLDLQDFPGQGTALVGILDAFMDSKGLITPEKWREFCSPTVPLVRMPRYTWTQSDRFKADVELAHYGPQALPEARLRWSIAGEDDKVIQSGVLSPTDVPQGSLTALGKIEFDLATFPAPAAYTLTAELEDGTAVNHYRIWVYPTDVEVAPPPGVVVAQSLDENARQALADGRPVLILPTAQALAESIPGVFQTDFWCYPMFKGYNPSGTLGILCDPKHPALAAFPTRFHSDWQWWPIVRHGRAMVLDNTPKDFRPVVQVIDNFERNHKLGLAFEARIGEGRLFVCSGALIEQSDRPESKQLLHSLLRYVASDQFNPKQTLDMATLETILPPPLPGIVLDDADAKLEGAWSPSKRMKPFVGEGYSYTGAEGAHGDGKATATFHFKAPETGRYQIRMAYSPHKSRATNIPVIISSGSAKTTLTVDQTKPIPDGKLFRLIGEANLQADVDSVIQISNADTTGYIIVDAIQLLPEK